MQDAYKHDTGTGLTSSGDEARCDLELARLVILSSH